MPNSSIRQAQDDAELIEASSIRQAQDDAELIEASK